MVVGDGMKCPACREPMLVLEWEQVEVDYCTNCKGTWLDSGELELLLEGAEEKQTVLGSFQKNEDSTDDRKCPSCHKKMESLLCGESAKLRVERCMRGHGLWFDRGELEPILKMGKFENPKVSRLLKNIFRSELKEI